ncbi:uncharacterized protein LOC124338206 [Daphnia pulicaria]|uniref:uncharacterized protein LOC124338206 n=1 Tax=Daphnia pulicaria TaxID=35523 RepID=UPI001EEB5B97|nr:uncharacterized protein LOC124338206 [Daphnia pulicaria]
MDWKAEKECLDELYRDPQANASDIIRIHQNIIKDANLATSSEVIKFLNQNAFQLLGPDAVVILKKNQLEAYSYLLVANNLLDLEDVKDDLLNGHVLANAIPAITLRRLKYQLGLAAASASSTSLTNLVEPIRSTSKPAKEENAHQTDPEWTSQQFAAVARVQPNIRQGETRQDVSRLANKIKNQCKFLKRLKENTFSYQLELNETTFDDATTAIKRFSFGEPNKLMGNQWKTILLMGETGSGKTTMINAMINYVLGVQWEDDFRFMLIKEDVRGGNQAHSQTQGVTAYDLHYQDGFRIPFSLTIVDTPGFGDTGGMDRDREITATIKEFFEHPNGIQELEAVSFVVKSSDARLTSSQIYVFDSVLNIFGKDMRDNIHFLVTFNDGGVPNVLNAIKEAKLPCQMDSNAWPCHFKFNNGAMDVQPSADDGMPVSSSGWKLSMKNFESFFVELNKMPKRLLQMTKEVLENRNYLEQQLEIMWVAIDERLTKIEELRNTEKIISENKEKIDSNQNFEITLTVSKKVKESIETFRNNQSALNCTNCEVTCHYPCNPNLWTNFCPAFWEFALSNIPQSTFNAMGSVSNLKTMNKSLTTTSRENSLELDYVNPGMVIFEAGMNLITQNRTCKVCPSKCQSSDHINERQRWVYKQVEEKQTLFDVRKRYEEAMGQQANAEGTLASLKAEIDRFKLNIFKAMKEITNCSNLLKSKALLGDSLTMVEYIQFKIDNEQKEKKHGYAERIKSFEDVLEIAIEYAEEEIEP